MENSFYHLAQIEIKYKPKFEPVERPQIDSANKAYQVLISNWISTKLNL